jgi:hypothetical protein
MLQLHKYDTNKQPQLSTTCLWAISSVFRDNDHWNSLCLVSFFWNKSTIPLSTVVMLKMLDTKWAENVKYISYSIYTHGTYDNQK